MTAISSQLLQYGANSPYLNPHNPFQTGFYLGKPVRMIGRLVWGLGSFSIGAICGVAYNAFQAIASFCRGKYDVAEKHLYGAGDDLVRAIIVSFFVIGILLCRQAKGKYNQNSLIWNEVIKNDAPYSVVTKAQQNSANNIVTMIWSGFGTLCCTSALLQFVFIPDSFTNATSYCFLDEKFYGEISFDI